MSTRERTIHSSNTDPEVERPFLSHSADDDPPSSPSPQTQGWSKLLIVTAVATTLGSVIPCGYNTGILNSPQKVIIDFCNESLLAHYGIEVEETPLELLWSSVVAICLVGGGIGALSGGPIANRIGRKNTLLLESILNIVAAVLFGTCGFAQSVEMLLLGRFVVGFAGGMATSFMPMFLAEMATPSTQNVLGTLCPIGMNLGLFVGQILSMGSLLGNEDYWNLLLALNCIPALISLSVWCLVPESPRYLFVIKGEEALAIKELSRLRGVPASELDREIELLRQEASSSKANDSSGWTLRAIWAKRNIRWPFLCVIVMHIGNQLSGINAVFYYSTDIFQSAGLDKQQAELALLGAGFTNLLMATSVAYTTGRFGRRPLMLISTIGVSVFLVILAVSIFYASTASWVAYCCIAAFLLYIVFFGIGISSLPFFLPTELIPAGPRPLIMSIGCMINWSCNFMVGMAFPSLETLMGVYVFAIFTGATLAQAVFLFFKLPETFQGRSRRN